MHDALPIALFVLYAVNSQWGFRFQRVGRGILLLAHDTAAGKPQVFRRIMPGSFVASVWVGRLLWLGTLVSGWRVWGWYSLAALLAYSFFVGAWLDEISPWPSYKRFLDAIKQRVVSGNAGVEGLLLLPTIHEVEEQMRSGVQFEDATTGAWMARPPRVDAVQRPE